MYARLRIAFAVVIAVLLVTASPVIAAPPTVDPALYGGLKWRNIGPPLGGRSIAVAGSVARPNEYYFGATGGGATRSMVFAGAGGTGPDPRRACQRYHGRQSGLFRVYNRSSRRRSIPSRRPSTDVEEPSRRTAQHDRTDSRHR